MDRTNASDALQQQSFEEVQRLTLLAELGVLDTDPEPGFDALTHAAATLTRCPIALISLVDGDRQWFKARLGIGQQQTPREWSFCSQAIRTPDLMEVHDVSADLRFADNPLVVNGPHIRFYAGHPLEVENVRIGTLCVIDTKPRALTLTERDGLQDLAVAASAMLSERRKRAATAEQQRRLTEFALVAGDWLWETDALHRLTWMSSAYGTHPPPPEPWRLGQPMDDAAVLESPDFPANVPTTLHRLLAAEGGFARALVRSDVAGGPRYLSHSAVARRDARGQWLGYRGITRDLTIAVTAELAHRAASKLLADLSAQVPGVIFQMLRDVQGRHSFRFVSSRVQDILELNANALMKDAKSALRRLRRGDVLPVMRAIQRSATRMETWHDTFQAGLPRAGQRDLQVHAAPAPTDDGGVIWHGIVTDITDQLRSAANIQRLTALDVVAQRSAQIRGEFLSRVSHEFRTPLNAILGFSQLIRLQGPSQPTTALLGSVLHIEQAGTHLLALVNDMLDLASLDTGNAAMHLEPVSLVALAEETVSLLGPLALHRRMTLEVSQTGIVPAVQADTRAVRQVLLNLLGNAIKFAHPDSCVQVYVRHKAGQAEVDMDISDQGPGMAPATLAALFAPFAGGSVARDRLSGTGLGLPISQKLVKAMGGRIQVSSVLGRGTTFTVGLPVAQTTGVAPPGAAGAAGPFAAPFHRGASVATVLCIEHTPTDALLMEAVFDSASLAHLALAVAVNGRDGIAQARALTPALILLDMQLLDMDGMAALAELRRDERTAGIPVIALSSDALPGQVSAAVTAGCEACWTKPINFEGVVAVLTQRFPMPASDSMADASAQIPVTPRKP